MIRSAYDYDDVISVKAPDIENKEAESTTLATEKQAPSSSSSSSPKEATGPDGSMFTVTLPDKPFKDLNRVCMHIW